MESIHHKIKSSVSVMSKQINPVLFFRCAECCVFSDRIGERFAKKLEVRSC